MKLFMELLNHDESNAKKTSYCFEEESGVIGSGSEADWNIAEQGENDACENLTIKYKSGIYSIKIDGNEQRIESGDRFWWGEYQIEARLIREDSSNISAGESQSIEDFIPDDSFIEEDGNLSVPELLSEKESKTDLEKMVIGDRNAKVDDVKNQDDLLIHSTPPRLVNSVNKDSTIDLDESHSWKEAGYAFFQGLGIDPEELGKSDRTKGMKNYGKALRRSISLMLALDETLTSMRDDLELHNMAVIREEHQPIECRELDEYITGTEALQVFRDIGRVLKESRASMTALLFACGETLKSFVSRMAPYRLMYQFENEGYLKRRMFKKAWCWKAYTKIFEHFNQSPHNINDLILKEYRENFKAATTIVKNMDRIEHES